MLLRFGDDACLEVAARGRQGRVAGAHDRRSACRCRRGSWCRPTCLADGGRRRGAARGAARPRARRRRSSPPREVPARGRRGVRGARASDPPVAVRCSACAEDSETASYAGQQETYLHVRGARRGARPRARLLGVVLLRAGDLLPPEEGLARRPRDGGGRAADGATRTSPACCSRATRCAGGATAWSSRPCSGSARPRCPGQVTPDHYILKRDGTIRKAQVSQQPFAIVPVEDGGVEERELGAEGGEQKLGEEHLRELARHRRRPRAAARRPAGHRVGARGRRDLRAAGEAGDDVILERAQAVDGRGASARPAPGAHARLAARARPRRAEAARIAAATHDIERAYPGRRLARGTPRATGTRPSTTAGTRTAART